MQIIGPTGHYLRFDFAELDLPYSYDCNTTDNVYIREANATSAADTDSRSQ